MKKLILSLFVATMFVPASYAQTAEEHYQALVVQAKKDLNCIKNSKDAVIEGLGDINPYYLAKCKFNNEAKEKNGVYYSESMKINFIAEYGVASCPDGYTKYSVDKDINYGCETVDEFNANVDKGYYKYKMSEPEDSKLQKFLKEFLETPKEVIIQIKQNALLKK